MFLYKTVFEYAEAEQVIQKSRFIARVKPVESYDEAQAFVAEVKKEYKAATHNVPAIIIGNKQEVKWASDDGEPSGTSGMPMLKLMSDLELTNLAVVVTRYFGGVKLGTGGLSRAYSSLAKAGIEAAGICGVTEGVEISYEIEYSVLPKIQNLAQNFNFSLEKIEYSDIVNVGLSCPLVDLEEVKTNIRNLSCGQAKITDEKSFLKKIKI